MDLSAAARVRAQAYLDELYRWNRRLNLTSVPREQAWARHVQDSLSILDAVTPPHGARVVDIGTGAGLPGIPLAITRADLEVTLLDADVRRCGVLVHVCGMLGLDRVTVLTGRAETLGRDAGVRETFDMAVSRATAAAPALCELALPLLRVGGTLAALVGDAPASAADSVRAAALCGGGPPRAAGAAVLVVGKLAATPDDYPRRPGIPARRPL